MTTQGEQVLLGSGAQLWCDLVRAGGCQAQAPLSEDAESYLVFLLLRHLKDSSLLARVMALEWLSAADTAGTCRQERLRDVGDRCLLMAGLFPQMAARRRVDHSYFIVLGQGAYDGVACASKAGYAALFAHLAAVYETMVRVLGAVASMAGSGQTHGSLAIPGGHALGFPRRRLMN